MTEAESSNGGDSVPKNCPAQQQAHQTDDDYLVSAERHRSDDDIPNSSSSLVVISNSILILAVIPLIIVALISWKLGLLNLSQGILEGCLRTFVQLTWLATLLGPIFRYGSQYPALVVGYCIFLILLAAYEASSRTKYDFDGQFVLVLISLALNVGGVALGTFGILLRKGLSRSCPWNPRYVIPIVGMLLGNSIGAVALSLNAFTRSMVEQQAEIELYLSMGASPYEAVARLLVDSITAGATPVLQMMRVTGIISIPGMMTGQILGSSSTHLAARYQMLILYLIALCTLSVILCNAWLVTSTVGFDHAILRTDRFVVSRRKSVLATLVWGLGVLWNEPAMLGVPPNDNNASILLRESGISIDTPSANKNDAAKSFMPEMEPNNFEIRSLRQSSCTANEQNSATCSSSIPPNEDTLDTLLYLRDMSKSFAADKNDASSRGKQEAHLFKDVDLNVTRGDLLLVSGSSGTGKSTLFKVIAGLVPTDTGTLELKSSNGQLMDWQHDCQEWRRQIRYVPQSKVDIPGTPADLLEKASRFQSWRDTDTTTTSERIISFLNQWGLSSDCLGKEWSQLSGGEAQRIMIAIALASKPMVILFDESTSALDKNTKMAVEESVKSYVQGREGAVLWISHDEEQAKRMSFHE